MISHVNYRRMIRLAGLCCLMLAFSMVVANQPFDEALAKRIEGRIMAPCCMANPISDHYSGAAAEIRAEIRRMLSEGKTEDQILQHYVDKHGELILAMPDPSGFNLTAYILPLVLLVVGCVGMTWFVRRWTSARPVEVAVTDPELPAIEGEYAERLQARLRDLD